MLDRLCTLFSSWLGRDARRRGAALLGVEALEERAVPAGGPLSPFDAFYLQHAAEGDVEEIVLGQLAMQRGANPAVQQFGQRLVLDHYNALVATLNVMGQDGVPFVPPGQDVMETIGRFSALSGQDFDRQFTAFMVQDHAQDIFLTATEAL